MTERKFIHPQLSATRKPVVDKAIHEYMNDGPQVLLEIT
jgi:hypothetical protein